MYRFGVYPKLNTFPTQTNRRHLNRMLPTNHPPVVPLGKTHCPNHNKPSLWFFRLVSVDQFQFVVCLEYQGGRFRRAFLESFAVSFSVQKNNSQVELSVSPVVNHLMFLDCRLSQ